MNNLVMIKSNKYGLLIQLDKAAPYKEIKEELKQKFEDARKFFKDAKMAVTFEGRNLTKVQEQELIRMISETAQIHIICLIDSNDKRESTYKSIVNQCLNQTTSLDGQFYKGTLGKRQILESDTSITILGDVAEGAKVVARGNIVVIGTVYGAVHAGAAGSHKAFIAALSMQASSLRIGDMKASKFLLEHAENMSMDPQIARVRKDRLQIDLLV